MAGIVTAAVVGLAVGALVLATGGIAAGIIGVTVTQLAVGTGVLTAGAGILATFGTYFNDKRNGTTSSLYDYMGNAYTASVAVGGSLEGLYLSLTGAEAFTYLMTGGSVVVPIFGMVISTKDIMAMVMLAAVEISELNVAFQLRDLVMFLSGEKPLRAPTGNQCYDTAKAWTEMISGYIVALGLQNPRTYGPTYGRLPDVALPVAANGGASESTALAAQNTGLVNVGGGSGAGSLALLSQINTQAANYALAIPEIGNAATNPVGAGGGGSQTRIFREATQQDADLISDIKSRYNAGKTRNAACAKGNINGESIDLECISGKLSPDNYYNKGNFNPPQPENYHYKGPIPEYTNHTEQKIIEYLREQFKDNPNVFGEIEIISERVFCDNCKVLVDMFESEFPNIKVIRVEVVK